MLIDTALKYDGMHGRVFFFPKLFLSKEEVAFI